jgi:hypothetical protein
VGSSSIKKIEEGYHGSVSSKQYKTLWESLLQSSPDAFKTEIYSIHKTRKEALEAELLFQIENDVVKSSEWINMSLARPNGFFGMDVSGENNPMYGKFGKNHPAYGTTHSKEFKEKITKLLKNRVFSQETIEKIKQAKKGKNTGENNAKSNWWKLNGTTHCRRRE